MEDMAKPCNEPPRRLSDILDSDILPFDDPIEPSNEDEKDGYAFVRSDEGGNDTSDEENAAAGALSISNPSDIRSEFKRVEDEKNP